MRTDGHTNMRKPIVIKFGKCVEVPVFGPSKMAASRSADVIKK
jgi:hypothetical protein